MLVNKQIRMMIGCRKVAGAWMLFVQEGKQVRYFAKFTSGEKAKEFMNVLQRWDEAGGNDESSNM